MGELIKNLFPYDALTGWLPRLPSGTEREPVFARLSSLEALDPDLGLEGWNFGEGLEGCREQLLVVLNNNGGSAGGVKVTHRAGVDE